MLKLKRYSMIDKIRKTNFKKKQDIPLKEGEEIILQTQGVLKFDQRSGWQPGHFYLTNLKLVFKQVVKIKMEIRLEDILHVGLGEAHFIGRKKKILLLEARKLNQRKIKVRILVEPVLPWFGKISRCNQEISKETLDEIFQKLDFESSSILDYFLMYRHAKINDIARFLGGMPHIDILNKIKEKINPAAEGIIGYPILSFNRLKVEPGSKGEIAFSWWLNGHIEERQPDSLLDIFDEGQSLSVIFEAPSCCEEDMRVEVADDILRVFTADEGKKYREEVVLPCSVKAGEFIKNFRNNILEIKLYKVVSNEKNENKPQKNTRVHRGD